MPVESSLGAAEQKVKRHTTLSESGLHKSTRSDLRAVDEGSKMWDSNDHIAASTTTAPSSEGMMYGSSVKRNVASSRACGIALHAEKSVDKLRRRKRFRCSGIVHLYGLAHTDCHRAIGRHEKACSRMCALYCARA